MPIQGFVRLRAHQFGRQADFGTKVAATRRYPHSGVPSVDLTWTDPEVDQGSRDPVAPPYRGPGDFTATLTNASLDYNSLTKILSGFFGGAVAPTGAGPDQTWVHEPASETVDELDPYTYEFGDDVLEDWFQFGDGIIESFELTAEDKGVVSSSETWRFGSVASTGSTDSPVTGTVPTPDLGLDIAAPIMYLKDMAIYIASDPDDLFTEPTKIVDALHAFTLRGSQEIDQKRFANGDQTFDIDAYGPGARTLELEAEWAKTTDTVGTGSESDAWHSDSAVNRYIGLQFISTANADGDPGSGGTPYSWDVVMPGRYYTREDGERGGNTVVTLNAHGFFDPGTGSGDATGVFTSTLVNTMTEADLGLAGS